MVRQTLSFFLFLLVTCVLLIRPTDFIPELGSLYLIVISASLLTSWTVVTEQLSVGSLERRPITVGVLGLLAAMVLSILYNFRLEMLVTGAFDFVKVTLYYLLMVGLVNSPVRLRCYLLSVAGILIVPIGLAVLHYYGIIHHPAFVMVEEGRMGGTGMFGDPNDVCLLINVGIMLSLYGLMSGRGRLVRFLWVAPLALFAVALSSTGSRGGLLACLASIAVLFVARYGTRKGFLLMMVVMPVILGQFAGRQVDFSITDQSNTGQLRSQLWSNALEVFKNSPIFGVGPDQTGEFIGRAVHNSFIQSLLGPGLRRRHVLRGSVLPCLWSAVPTPTAIGCRGRLQVGAYAAVHHGSHDWLRDYDDVYQPFIPRGDLRDPGDGGCLHSPCRRRPTPLASG